MDTPFVLFLGDIGGSELMLIMVVILIFFGANKIPELARGLGKGIREFKDASTEIRREFEQAGQPNPNQGYQPQNQYPQPEQQFQSTPLPTAPVAEAGSGFDPWAAPTAPAMPTADQHDPAPPVATVLPPNLAPEGTQPRQPYLPANPGV
jgi:sec-independent protein translocase protein TatA